jgi:hypothetical protein
MSAHPPDVHPGKRLAYAFVALLAGNTALFLFLLQNALRVRSMLVAEHMGEPARVIPAMLQQFVLYAMFSFLGWLLVGVPIAVFFRAGSIAGLSWPLALLIGAALGPLALLGIFPVLNRGHFPSSFAHTGWFWCFSALVSTVSFAVYAGVLRKKISDEDN